MTSTRKLLLAGAIAGLGLASTVAPAKADPLDTTFTVNIWNFQCANCTEGKASQDALPTNPDATSAHQLYANATYTGPLDFSLGSGGTNTIGAFLQSGGGISSPNLNADTHKLSTGTYGNGNNQWTTLMEFSFNIGSSVNAIFHDDGVSLFSSGNSTDLLPPADAGPTNEAESDITLAPGSYNLWYVEANGLPAVLNFQTTPVTSPVPEPGSLALLGTALLGFGMIGSMRRRA